MSAVESAKLIKKFGAAAGVVKTVLERSFNEAFRCDARCLK